MIKEPIVKQVSINATAAEVWRALTDPATIRKYFFDTEVVSDWKTGGPIVFRGEWNGMTYEDKGAILEITPEKSLKYSYWSSVSGIEDIPENYAEIEYRLQENEGRTILTATQDRFKDKEAREHSIQGWEEVLNNLKELLEKQAQQ